MSPVVVGFVLSLKKNIFICLFGCTESWFCCHCGENKSSAISCQRVFNYSRFWHFYFVLKCLSLFGLLSQKYCRLGGLKNTFISHSVNARESESKGPAAITLPGVSCVGAPNPCVVAPPHILLTCQRPHLLIPPHWGL